MKHATHKILGLTRIAMGTLFFYAGITKILNPEWTAKGYLEGAQTLTGLYQWMAQPGILPYIDVLNKWGLTLIGIALLLGIGSRTASIFGAIMMLLYYFPELNFPYVGEHSFLVDEHIIYALVLLTLYSTNAGSYLGFQGRFRRK